MRSDRTAADVAALTGLPLRDVYDALRGGRTVGELLEWRQPDAWQRSMIVSDHTVYAKLFLAQRRHHPRRRRPKKTSSRTI